jgi:hypothetical protein
MTRETLLGLAGCVRAMPSARAFALRVEPCCAVSPALAASIAIAKECGNGRH